MTPFRITLSYDGAGFVGWQRQASGVSIQGLIEDVLQVLDGRPVTVIGAAGGRGTHGDADGARAGAPGTGREGWGRDRVSRSWRRGRAWGAPDRTTGSAVGAAFCD